MLINGLLVAAGAVPGVFARIYLTKYLNRWSAGEFPLGTFTINLSGTLTLGAVTALGCGAPFLLFAGIGFLGTYTTFSTLIIESFELWRRKRRKIFWLYFVSSMIGGIVAVSLGLIIGNWLRSFL